MEKLQRTTKGQHFILIPGEMIKLARWKEGDNIDVRSGLDITPKKGDLILRKVL
jgi:hypothetical protein